MRGLDLAMLVEWPGWPWVGLGAAALAVGLLAGIWLGRRGRPDLGPAEVLMALERVVRRDFEGAYRLLEDATWSADAPPEIYLALASLLRATGQTERSAQVHKALTLRPGLDRIMATRAVIGLAGDCLTLGRSAEAEALLASLPDNVRKQEALLALRRNAAIRAGDWKEALATGGLLSKQTGKGGEGASEIYGRMASSALGRGDQAEAVRNFKRALSANRANVYASEGLARIYVEQNKLYRARLLMERALEGNGHIAPRLFPLMRAALRSPSKYHQFIEKLVERGRASPWAELELAELAYGAEDFDEAAAILSDLVERYPHALDVREAYLNLLVAVSDERVIFAEVDRFVALAKASMARFVCGSCAHAAPFTFVTCPRCGAHGTVHYAPLER